MQKLKNFFYLFFPLIIGGVVGFVIKDYIDYPNLNQPPFAPPSFLFPIAWTILYFLMGLSYYLVKRKEEDTPKISFLYYAQLFVNALWSIFFFLLKWRLFSILWIFLLIALVIALILSLFPNYKTSAYLLIPYLLWLCFATYLNIGVYLLN